MNMSHRSGSAILAWFATLVLLCARPSVAYGQQTTGPHWPVHPLDLGQDQQSLVLRLQFDGPQEVSLESARVVTGRAHGRRTEPPLLRVIVRDAAGALLDQFNAWHPMWSLRFDGPSERRVLRPGSGRFVMPYSPNIAKVEVRDVRLDAELIAVQFADLAVNSIAPVGVPADVVIGQAFAVTLNSVVTNHGPATPMDLRLTTTATPSAGTLVVPIADDEDALALAQGEIRTLTQTFSVTCQQPGAHTVSFTAVVKPLSAVNADLNLTNNQATTQISVDCVVPVAINIKPRSLDNPINLDETAIPVTVLTTAAGEYGLPLAFTATTIDPLTVRFGPEPLVFAGGGGSEVHGRGHLENSLEKDERTRDGDLDMVLHFNAVQSSLFLGQTKACVKGLYQDLTSGSYFKFFGCDAMYVVP